ncbi:hypothetical protein [Lysobacter capsici]|nr:hypothetical protein [Lysobacter capsici]
MNQPNACSLARDGTVSTQRTSHPRSANTMAMSTIKADTTQSIRSRIDVESANDLNFADRGSAQSQARVAAD